MYRGNREANDFAGRTSPDHKEKFGSGRSAAAVRRQHARVRNFALWAEGRGIPKQQVSPDLSLRIPANTEREHARRNGQSPRMPRLHLLIRVPSVTPTVSCS